MADKGEFPFGTKLSEFKEEVETPTPEAPIEEVKNEPVLESKTEAPKEEVRKEVEKKAESPKRTWLDEANDTFKTTFKSPDELKSVFEKAKKADEYEPKIKGFEEVESKYKKQINDLQGSLNPLSYFSSQESYVAEQLRRQFPDKSPSILQDVVTLDNKRMDDLDVLIKNQMLETPDLIGGENGAKEYILDKYGIDPTTPKEEWSTTLRNKLKIEANQARKTWDELKGKVELPKVMTPEQKEALRTQQLAETEAKLKPIKETFSKFDEFTAEIEDGKQFKFITPDEYKETLPEMFNTYFLQAGVEPTQQNLNALEDLKKGLMLLKYFPKVYKTIEADTETRLKAERDELLGNTTPPNTKTAAEQGLDDDQKFSNEYGFGKMFSKK